MNDQIKALRSKDFFDGRSIGNVQCRVCKPLGHTLQPLQIPESVACEAKESPAHAVVNANNFTLGAKKWDRPEPSLVEF